jgi:hypothetical protein
MLIERLRETLDYTRLVEPLAANAMPVAAPSTASNDHRDPFEVRIVSRVAASTSSG